MADPIFTVAAVEKLSGASNTFLSIIDGVLRLRVEGRVAQSFEPEQFQDVVEELRTHGWYTRKVRTFRDGDYAMCAQYKSAESEEGREPAEDAE